MKSLPLLISIILILAGPAGAANLVSINEPGPGDTLWFGVPHTLDISLENDSTLGAMSLGFQIWSPDGATWTWDNVGGLGTLGCVTVTGGRLDPVAGTGSFDMTGLLVTEQNVDGLGSDTIMCGGVALNNGLQIGPLEHLYSYHFTPYAPEQDLKYMICFDSCFVPPSGAFVFVNLAGDAWAPTVTWGAGGVCWPISGMCCACPEWDMGNPTSMTVDHCEIGHVTLSATDAQDNAIAFQLNSHTGSGSAQVIDNGDGTCQVVYTPVSADVGQAVSITVDVTSAIFPWGECDTWTLNVNVTNNPPTVDCGQFDNPVPMGHTLIKTDIFGSDVDGCDVLTYSLCGVMPTPIGNYGIDVTTGEFWFETDPDDMPTNFTFCVEVTDGYDVAQCIFEAEVHGVQLWEIKIEKVHDALQGHFADVDVCLNAGSDIMGGFDFLIGYDASALAFTEAVLGDFLIQCGWEYFTYRYSWNGNCGNACPTGLVRLIGLAETNNGPNHPNWGCLTQFEPGLDCHDCGTPIATLTFFVSNDRTLECMYVPIRFYWMDCNDNSISVPSGDTLGVNYKIYDYLGGDLGYQEIQDYNFGVPGYYGIPDDPCMQGDKEFPIRFVDYCNGGIDIVCADSIDARGDINVNGVPNEIADAVMFTNYFISGLSAFGDHPEASIAASDVNADGIALSVADLVYLVRVIVGDANPYPKPLPESPVTISARAGMVEYNSPVDIGAALLTFHVSGEAGSPQLSPGAAGMDIKYARQGDELRVLVYNIGTEMIPAGENALLTIPGEVELTDAEVATYDGFGINTLIRALPTEFMVSNHPNPFNPKTTISLNLPSAAEWSVDIYNVAGQLIRKYSGYSEAGEHNVEWDGTDGDGSTVASGIYIYKVRAGQYSATRKMVLMK
jgi:hypothetical protein